METRAARISLSVWTLAVVLFLWLPLVLICVYAFNSSNIQSWPIAGFSTKWFGSAWHDQDARDAHKMPYADVAWEADRVKLLQGIEQTEFFKTIRGDLVVSLYNQKEVWPRFGYEGSSAEHGGYINRGFADIDWLPKA